MNAALLRKRIWWIGSLLVALGLVALILAASHHEARNTGRETPSQILRAVMARVGDPKIEAHLTLTRAQLGHPDGYEIDFHIDGISAGAESVRSTWMADLIAGQVADLLAFNNDPPLVRAAMVTDLRDGQSSDVSTGISGDVTAGQAFSSATDPSISASVEKGLAGTDARLVSLDVVRAGQPAPAVVVRISDPSKALASESKLLGRLFLQGHPLRPIYAGYYLEIEDVAGHPLTVYASSYQTETIHWTAPSLGAGGDKFGP